MQIVLDLVWIVSYSLLTHGNCFTQKELKRLVAYARSSANLLNKLILQDQIDSYKWEVSLKHLSGFRGLWFFNFFDFYVHELLQHHFFFLAVPSPNSFEQL